MKKKIVYLPLDERPCNYKFPTSLFETGGVELIVPPKLGSKKNAANPDDIIGFLQKECANADGLIIAVDTLLYGGLVPSRLHHLEKEAVQSRLEILARLKKANPSLIIYAFQTIMRCPRYSSSDEEPAYYDAYGREIWEIGATRHRYQLGLCDDLGLSELYNSVDETDLRDYQYRRAFNLGFVCKTLELVTQDIIDFMIIPQDDTEPFGFAAMDQEQVRLKIRDTLLQDRVLLYPGADEIGMVLTSRIALHFAACTPRVFVRYAAVGAPTIVPMYEDRPLGETVKSQIMAAGCRFACSLADADFVLAINCPAAEMREAVMQPAESRYYTIERNLPEFLFFIEDCVQLGKPVIVGDNAFVNGGDLELARLMNKRNLLGKIAGYAGWGTSSNTLGTALGQGVHHLLCGSDTPHKNFLAQRYVEDVTYCSAVRRNITEHYLPDWGMDASDTQAEEGKVSEMVLQKLEEMKLEILSSISKTIIIEAVKMPWRRMFEVDVTVRCIYHSET